MTSVFLTINGEAVEADIEPRTHLGDFLREHRLLTGTHLGCEHGICGACTVQIDGEPSRSCITLAVACDGADIRTIEGFDEDVLMGKLRDAFRREHALQCGYCTPGMLIAARDLILRLPDADEGRIRIEMEGNLCRCTGYVGIIRAIASVVGEPAVEIEEELLDSSAITVVPNESKIVDRVELPANASRLSQGFRSRQPIGAVWSLFRNIEEVAGCLPGAELTSKNDNGRVEGRIVAGLGPIRAAFSGRADVQFDDVTKTGTVKGSGSDRATGSGAIGEVSFAVSEVEGGTKVDLEIVYSLSGTLAQFGRGDLAIGVAQGLVDRFASNLEAKLSGQSISAEAASLNAGSLVWQSIRTWFRKLFGAD